MLQCNSNDASSIFDPHNNFRFSKIVEDLRSTDKHNNDHGLNSLHPQTERNRSNNIRYLSAEHSNPKSIKSIQFINMVPYLPSWCVFLGQSILLYQSPHRPPHPYHGFRLSQYFSITIIGQQTPSIKNDIK